MDELRESSLLFSLEGLLETERERVQREARDAQRRRDDEMIRVAEQASRRRLAAEQEREARERRAALEQERERLDEERIVAMKRATVERARIETEGKLRLVEVEQARKHELMLSQLRAGQLTARYRGLTWLGSAACAVSVVSAFVVHFGYVRPAFAREAQQLQTTIRVNAEQGKTTERELATERSRNQTLSERVRQLEEQNKSLSLPVGTGQGFGAGHKRPPTPVHGRGPGTGPATPTPTNCPDNGDPLQGCLSGRRR